MTEHDFTQTWWGHNISILNWNKETRSGQAMCWVTPGLRNRDIVIVKSENGSMKMRATNVKWMSNVNDMYSFDISPVGEEQEEELWVAKVRRYDGGYSILDVLTKEKAETLANEFNKQYQTDNYYIEKYDKERHAYSRNG